MTRKAKTPAAVGAASGGGRDALAGAERADHTLSRGSVTRLSYLAEDRWLGQVARDPRLGDAAIRAALGVSTFLRHEGTEGAASTVVALDAVAGASRSGDRASKSLRQGLLSLGGAGHFWIDRSVGRGPRRSRRYALILKGRLA